MNILITSAGRRVSLLRAFKKELRNFFPDGKILASDAEPLLSAACLVADDYFKVPLLNESNYFDKLIDICKTKDVKLIVPTIDTELLLLAENRERLKEIGVTAVISSTDFIKTCRNKRLIHDFFFSKGVQAPYEFKKDNYKLPLFIKPYDGSRSVDTYLIEKESDLNSYHFENDKLMFLEYLDHKEFDEFTCDLYYTKSGKLKCVVPRKRLSVRDGEVYKALTKKNVLVDYIKTHLGTIDGARGCLTAQFFLHHEDESKIYGIEINPRFGGGFPLTYLAGGNFPRWIIEEYCLDQNIDDYFEDWEGDLLMVRYDDEILVHGYQG